MKKLFLITTLCAAAALAAPAGAHAQFWEDVKETAENAVSDETQNQIDRLLRDAVRCTFDDLDCIQRAEESGEEVVLTDEDGEVLTTEDGTPVTDRSQLPPEQRAAATPPGEGAEVNYDFEAGTDVILSEDYSGDNVGDFPRGFEFVRGNWEVAEWQGRRLLRNTSDAGTIRIPLPESLPERFTIETEAHLPHGNQQLGLYTTAFDTRASQFQGQYFNIAGNHGTGVAGRGEGTVEALQDDERLQEELIPVRIMVDGTYAKVYVGERRVANVPNAEFARGDALQIENLYFASPENPILIGPIRVAAGGRDLYDVLEAKGRVTVDDILFDTNAATIQPSSAEPLGEIAAMLQEHADLSLLIQGHTDDQGGFEHNMTLSKERAAAVKAWLVEEQGISADRLKTIGLGSTQPVASNDTEDGRAQNRRVELVRIDGEG